MAGATRYLLAVAGTLAVLATPLAHDRVTTPITWDREISPIVKARCTTCHRNGGRAPMPLGTYAEAKPWARAIKEQVLRRRMPKWHAARGFGDIANDPSLSPFEIAAIAAWVDGGAPEKPAATSASTLQLPAPAAYAFEPRAARTVTLACATETVPPGELVAIRLALSRGASAGVSIDWPEGRRDIIVWVRDYEPEFQETYWLRRPVTLSARARLHVESASPSCTIELSLVTAR
jgi:mono/diheme cytochrome c family protein